MISVQRRIICIVPTSCLKTNAKYARWHSSGAAPFSKLLLNREEYHKVFNVAMLRLIYSFPIQKHVQNIIMQILVE